LCLLVPVIMTACGDVHHDTDAGQPVADGSQVIRTVTVQRDQGGGGTVTSTVGGIDCGATCAAHVPDGTTMVLTASPDEKSVFAGWSGPCSGTERMCTFTVSGDVTVSAAFAVKRYTVTVMIADPGSGTVTGAPGGLSCPGNCSISVDVGTQVTLTAAANPGWRAPSWSVAACSGTGPCVLTINGDQTVTATFIPISCGNGIKEGTEECDDGNGNDHDDCTNACKVAKCGDGIQKTVGANLEQCDDANTNDHDDCTNACKVARCGDGIQKTVGANLEQCDDGNTNDHDDCTNACRTATCGDGIQKTVGANLEQCDDGNGSNTDDCTNACKNAVCGDRFVWGGHEQCDDGPTGDSFCTASCHCGGPGEPCCQTGPKCGAGTGCTANNLCSACPVPDSRIEVCQSGFPGSRTCTDTIASVFDIITGSIAVTISGVNGEVTHSATQNGARQINFSATVHEGDVFNPGKNTTAYNVSWCRLLN
jgi:cysteine-rich repeat protein